MVPNSAMELKDIEGGVRIGGADADAHTGRQVPQGRYSGKKAWNPRWLGLYAFFGSFLVAGILWIINYQRFGNVSAKQSAQIKIACETIGFFTIEILWGIPSWVIILLNIVNGVYFSVSQKQEFRDFLKQGGRAASYWPPIGIQFAAAIVIGTMISLLAPYIVDDEAETSLLQQISNEVEAGRYEQAKELAVAADKNEFGMREGSFYLAKELFRKGRSDIGLEFIEARLEEYPGDYLLTSVGSLLRADVLRSRLEKDSAIVEIDRYLLEFPGDTMAIRLKSMIMVLNAGGS